MYGLCRASPLLLHYTACVASEALGVELKLWNIPDTGENEKGKGEKGREGKNEEEKEGEKEREKEGEKGERRRGGRGGTHTEIAMCVKWDARTIHRSL